MNGEVFDDAALRMHEADNVATAIADLDAGERVETGEGTVTLAEAVPFGHKFLLVPLDAGDEVYKYGEVIGRATAKIATGEWVHTHNCESTRGRGDLTAGGANGNGVDTANNPVRRSSPNGADDAPDAGDVVDDATNCDGDAPDDRNTDDTTAESGTDVAPTADHADGGKHP